MSTGAQAAIHNTDQECRPEFKWQDFNRFFNGDCVSFGIRTAGDIDIALATLPTRPEGALLMARSPCSPLCVWGVAGWF